MSENYILLMKKQGRKKERGFMSLKSGSSKVELLPGTLLFLTETFTKEGRYIFLLETFDQDTVDVQCIPGEIEKIGPGALDLLLPVATCQDRLAVYQDKEWLKEGLSLQVDDYVYVKAKGEQREMPAVIRWKGNGQSTKGILFLVELTDDRGAGTSDGTIRKVRYFQCPQDSALLCPVHRIRKRSPGARPRRRQDDSYTTVHIPSQDFPNCRLRLGDRVVWMSDRGPECGAVKWIGILPDDRTGEITVGVEFDSPVGSGTGKYKEHRLFYARQNHASFVPILGLLKPKEEEIFNPVMPRARPAGPYADPDSSDNEQTLPLVLSPQPPHQQRATMRTSTTVSQPALPSQSQPREEDDATDQFPTEVRGQPSTSYNTQRLFQRRPQSSTSAVPTPAISAEGNNATRSQPSTSYNTQRLIQRRPQSTTSAVSTPATVRGQPSTSYNTQRLFQRRPQSSTSAVPTPAISAEGNNATRSQPSTSYNTQRDYADLIFYSDEEDEVQAAIEASLADTPNRGNSTDVKDVLQRIQDQVIPGSPPTQVNVVRGKILDGASRALKRPSFQQSAPISVKFMDDIGMSEGAVDEGGPRREFFTLALREIYESQMFSGPPTSKFIVPNQTAMDKDRYFIAGALIALSLAHGGPAPQFFADKFYQWMAYGYERTVSALSLRDIPEGADIFHKLCRVNDAEDMEGLMEAVDGISEFLEVAGCNFAIRSMEDKDRLVRACVRFYTLDRACSAMTRFMEGLSIVNVRKEVTENADLCSVLFCESVSTLVPQDLHGLFKPALAPQGSNSRRKQVNALAFWSDLLIDVHEGNSSLSLSGILMFATGTDRVPPGGFDTAPQLEFLMGEGRYPTANTCSCILRIPVAHTEFNEFKDAFEFGVNNATGFGLA